MKLRYPVSAERGSLIFAILQFGAAAVSTAFSIGTLVYCGTLILSDTQTNFQGSDNLSLLIALIFTIMSSSFTQLMISTILITGIVKKNPLSVKVYFVYGIIVILVSILTCGMYITLSKGDSKVLFSTVILLCGLFIVFYSMILLMIRRTYKKFENDPSSNQSFVSEVKGIIMNDASYSAVKHKKNVDT